MATLKQRLAQQLPGLRERWHQLAREHGKREISRVTIEQALGGARGVRMLVCDTSLVEADHGLTVRGRPIRSLEDRLPEEVLWLLLTGELPTFEELTTLQAEMRAHADVPGYVREVLEAMPATSHPMTMLSTAVLSLESESLFSRRYQAGMRKEDYWEATLEDLLRLLAKLPAIAATIYRLRFDKGPHIASNPRLDWAADYVHMLGLDDTAGEMRRLMRRYLVLHCDHEGGNVSAMTAATVSSALSDLAYALSAGFNGLAGPLHGLANQECLAWILETMRQFGGVPAEDELHQHVSETLSAGRVVPGYGHAVLRVTDPRFESLLEFGEDHCPEDPVFQTVARTFRVVPEALRQVQKIKDPWPNVDAASGSLLYHYGLRELPYYTVVFALSRALGIGAQAVLARGLGYPIMRPKSVTTEWLHAHVGEEPGRAGREPTHPSPQ